MITKEITIEYDEIDHVPAWVHALFTPENALSAELEIEISWSSGISETRTDPVDPGELWFRMSIHNGERLVAFKEEWLTKAAWTRLNEFAENAAQEYVIEDEAAHDEYLYDQWQDRNL